jgi:hypothetical protein
MRYQGTYRANRIDWLGARLRAIPAGIRMPALSAYM